MPLPPIRNKVEVLKKD